MTVDKDVVDDYAPDFWDYMEEGDIEGARETLRENFDNLPDWYINQLVADYKQYGTILNEYEREELIYERGEELKGGEIIQYTKEISFTKTKAGRIAPFKTVKEVKGKKYFFDKKGRFVTHT